MTSTADNDAVVRALNKRLVRVALSHEEAVRIRNELTTYTQGSIWTDRYSGHDQFHIALSQDAAACLLEVLVRHEKRTALNTLKAALQRIPHRLDRSKER